MPRTGHLDMALSYLCCCHTALLLQRFASNSAPTLFTTGPEPEYAPTVIRIHILLWILSFVCTMFLCIAP